jgi:peptidoglycan/xylan/chitin deacetylase (PgdA/CDA1 family)
MTLGRVVEAATRVPLVSRMLALAERRMPAPRNRLAVLTYHRVDEPGRRPDLNDGLISAHPADFAAQVGMLADEYRVVSMLDVLAAARGERPLPPSSVLVTFDDAYRDFADHAWPVLRRLGLPVTLFVPTAYPDQPARRFWWDRVAAALMGSPRSGTITTSAGELVLGDRATRAAAVPQVGAAFKSMPHQEMLAAVDRLEMELDVERAPAPEPAVLDWDELRRLEGEGVHLAPHSRTHPRLDRVADDALDGEVAGARADLAREVDAPLPVLAYPDGAHSNAAVEAVRAAGYELAFTTRRGSVRIGRSDLMRLRRINVGQRTNPAILRAQLLLLTRAGPG